jgi:hypothetical protein
MYKKAPLPVLPQRGRELEDIKVLPFAEDLAGAFLW